MDSSLPEYDRVGSIAGAFFDVYNYFGYGFAESVYAGALRQELIARGHQIAREVAVPVRYKDKIVAWQRLDLIVDGAVIVEIKASETLPAYARRQILNYLRATPYEVGLLMHFGPKPHFDRFIDTKPRTHLSHSPSRPNALTTP
ncbi:MAG TPA: GxxExxY protein [Gemmatimonadaceae bacterium]|jgi:GxxExxY protein